MATGRWLVGKKYNKQELELLKAGFMGIQLSGLSNKLTGDFTGVQLTGGFNLNGGSGSGFQVAGLLNFNQEYFEGVQVSGLINYNGKYTSGTQLAGFLNYSVGDVYGLQLAIVNRAKNIFGRKSVLDLGHGVQLGLANFSGNMDGYQVGLINKTKEAKGLQIGLINIYKKNKDGIPIALFNYGDGSETLRLWMSELFLLNVGLGTGSKKVRNTIFFSYNPFLHPSWPRRAFGYSLARIWFPSNGEKYRSLELAFAWTNYERSIKQNSFNLLMTPKYVYGIHMGRGVYYDIGVGLNYFVIPLENRYRAGFFNSTIWPSLTLGFHSD